MERFVPERYTQPMSPRRKKAGAIITWAGFALALNMVIITLMRLGISLAHQPIGFLAEGYVMSSNGFAQALYLSAFFGFVLLVAGMLVAWRVKLPAMGIGLIVLIFCFDAVVYFIPPPAY